MSQAQELLERYKQIRARLRNPPNAVPDAGINLSRRVEQPPPQPQLQPIPQKLEEQLPPPKTPLIGGLTFSSTLQITAEEFGITPNEIKAKRRLKSIALPRQVAIYIATTKHGRGLSWLGRYLDLDHTTVLHARKKISSLVLSDPEFKDRVDNIENKIALFAASTLPPDRQPHLETQPNGNVPLEGVSRLD